MFEATIGSFSTATPPAARFAVPAGPTAVDEGFRPGPFPSAGPLVPTGTAGLRPVRFGTFDRSGTLPYVESVAAYARGLAWLTIMSSFNVSAQMIAPAWVSARVLSAYGNLSSPFVYFVLELALRERAPSGSWWMCSFGAGFSCHGALLAVA